MFVCPFEFARPRLTCMRAYQRFLLVCLFIRSFVHSFVSYIVASVRPSVRLSVCLSVCNRLMQVSLCVPSSFRESICLIFRPYEKYVCLYVRMHARQTDVRSIVRTLVSFVSRYVHTDGLDRQTDAISARWTD